MKNRSLFLSIIFCALLGSGWLTPQEAIGQIQVNGGNITMSISTAFPGSEPVAVINTLTSLRYPRENVVTKITVRTNCTGQNFGLSVVALAVGGGTAAPQVVLINGMPDTDFITGIPGRPPGGFMTATLQYTATATFAQGNSTELGDDVHTVTYTLIAQ